jgi:hypothetical protein
MIEALVVISHHRFLFNAHLCAVHNQNSTDKLQSQPLPEARSETGAQIERTL